eukprot:4962686-Prymnesium_polylepis.1
MSAWEPIPAHESSHTMLTCVRTRFDGPTVPSAEYQRKAPQSREWRARAFRSCVRMGTRRTRAQR